jgi:hypothetical protein
MIVEEPRGAVTNAVCALAALHYRRMRIAQGLEAPDPNPEHSMAKFFHDEAYYQLVNAKQLRGHYNESDAIAALHLVSFSLLSGGNTDWRTVLTVALDWLGQTGLAGDENPRLAMFNMSFASRCALKKTMVCYLTSCPLDGVLTVSFLFFLVVGYLLKSNLRETTKVSCLLPAVASRWRRQWRWSRLLGWV